MLLHIHPMQSGESDGNADGSYDVEFLSPDESPPKKQVDDTGASPTLRRSNRMRKSVTTAEMTIGVRLKKEKIQSHPHRRNRQEHAESGENPQGASAEPRLSGQSNDGELKPVTEIEKLLQAMEVRLFPKMNAMNRAVNEVVMMSRLTNDTLEQLEEKVDSNDALLRKAVAENQERIMDVVKDMINKQLKVAGFALNSLQA